MSNGGDNFYTIFFNEAKKQKDNWEPIKQGLFNGKYEIFEEAYNRAELFYHKTE
jgi:hypothetical protein